MAATLPQDVLELIFDYVEPGPFTPGHKRFSDLCLVSRSFLPGARRRLYKEPLYGFRCGASDRAHRAVSLVESLQANDNHLGGLVKDLANLANVYVSLRTVEDSIDSHSSATRPDKGVLRITVAFESALQLPKLFRTLAFSDMTSLSLRPFNHSAADALSPRMLSSLSTAAKLSDLTLDLQRLDIVAGTGAKPQLPLKLQKLSIRGESVRLTHVLQFLPTDSTFLREVDLFVAGSYSQECLLEMVRHMPHLTKLRMRRSPFPEYAYRRDSYGAGGAALLVPHEFYALLPNLEDLQLQGLAALSLNASVSSPSIHRNLHISTVWTPSGSKTTQLPPSSPSTTLRTHFSRSSTSNTRISELSQFRTVPWRRVKRRSPARLTWGGVPVTCHAPPAASITTT
ncbi:hypothetical protein JCM10296v2_005272 [Rhodotorula toruloides]